MLSDSGRKLESLKKTWREHANFTWKDPSLELNQPPLASPDSLFTPLTSNSCDFRPSPAIYKQKSKLAPISNYNNVAFSITPKVIWSLWKTKNPNHLSLLHTAHISWSKSSKALKSLSLIFYFILLGEAGSWLKSVYKEIWLNCACQEIKVYLHFWTSPSLLHVFRSLLCWPFGKLKKENHLCLKPTSLKDQR